VYQHYYIILDVNGLRTTSLIAIISLTICRPAKFVIVTGLGVYAFLNRCQNFLNRCNISC